MPEEGVGTNNCPTPLARRRCTVMEGLLDSPVFGDLNRDLRDADRLVELGPQGYALELLDEHRLGAAGYQAQ